MRRGLTTAQETFAQWVAELDNQSEAYRRAYPRSRSWTPGAVHCRASKLMSDATVMQRVTELRETRRAAFEAEVRRQGVQPEDVIREQGYVAFFNPGSLFSDDGTPLPFERLPEPARRGLKKFKTRHDEDGNLVYFEFVAADKLKALHDIGDHLGMYRQTRQHHWADDLANMTDEELEREAEKAQAELQRALSERNRLLAS